MQIKINRSFCPQCTCYIEVCNRCGKHTTIRNPDCFLECMMPRLPEELTLCNECILQLKYSIGKNGHVKKG